MACTFGTQAKSTSPAFFTFEQSDILSSIPTWGAWVALRTLGLPIAPTETASFCAVQPTGDLPLVTDWALIAFPPLAAFFGAYERLRNQVIAWKFSELCECAPAPGGTCAPTWLPTFAFPAPHSTGGNSFELGTEWNQVGTSSPLYGIDTWFPNAPQGSTVNFKLYESGTGLIWTQGIAYAGSGYKRYTPTSPPTCQAGKTYILEFCAAASTNITDTTTAPTGNSQVVFTRPTYAVTCGNIPNTTAGSWSPIAPVVCVGGGPGGTPTPIDAPPNPPTPTDFPAPPAGPTCASYQDVCNELSVLLQEIESVQANLSIIRQTKVPDTAVYGTPHTGLTGHGTIAAVGILGCSVTLTSVPSAWGYTLETPKRYVPKVGAIHFSDGTFNSDELQIHYDVQLVTDAPTFTTMIVYDFRPGITATVTPLLVAAPV